MSNPLLHSHVDFVFRFVASAIGHFFVEFRRHHGDVQRPHLLHVELRQIVPHGRNWLAQGCAIERRHHRISNIDHHGHHVSPAHNLFRVDSECFTKSIAIAPTRFFAGSRDFVHKDLVALRFQDPIATLGQHRLTTQCQIRGQ